MPSIPLQRYGLMARSAGTSFTCNQENLDAFWKFIFERHSIWFKRFKLEQEAPWTKDPVLQEYKFTNVYRELDRGTIFLLDNIINNELSEIEQVFNIIFYRMWNRVETYKRVGHQRLAPSRVHPGKLIWPNKQDTWGTLEQVYKSGDSLWTDAHMVCAYEHFPGDNKFERFQYIFKRVLAHLPEIFQVVKTSKSLKDIHNRLCEVPGIGPFNAYEIAVDISYCKWNNHSEDEWVNPGPGCQRGLKFIFPGIKPNECTQMIHVLRQVQEEEFTRLRLPFKEIAYEGKDLTLRNIEHCLCEAFKWFKAVNNTGRPRNKFTLRAKVGTSTFNRLKG